MNRRLMSIVFGACLTVAAATFSAVASADTVKIGSTLGHAANPNGELCTNCVGVQRAQVGGNSPQPLISPANGLVTQWAVRTSDPGAIYNLRILRPATNTSYTGAGTGPAVAVPAGTTDSVLINTISVPIKQGDAIGVSVNAGHELPSWPDNVSADVVGYLPPLVDGTSSGNTTDNSGHELLIQATVSFCNVPNVHK